MTYNRANRTANTEMTETTVRMLRVEAAAGMTTRALSEKYHIGPEAVRRIIRRDSWKWLDVENNHIPSPDLSEDAIARSAAIVFAAAQKVDPILDAAAKVLRQKGEKQPITKAEWLRIEGYGADMSQYIVIADAVPGGLTPKSLGALLGEPEETELAISQKGDIPSNPLEEG